jgi:hypothetical protein
LPSKFRLCDNKSIRKGRLMPENLEPTEEELASLLDKAVFETGEGALTTPQRAEKVFRDHSYDAAVSIVNLAKHAPNDNTKLRAAQYVVDRACGPVVKDSGGSEDKKDELVEAMDIFTKAIEADRR